MNSLKPLRIIGIFTLTALFLLTLFRLGLITWQWDRVQTTHGLMNILVQGIRFDLILLGLLLLLPATLTPIAASISETVSRYWFQILRVYLLTCMVLILFMELSTPSFIAQYDARPNYLFVEYLKYPVEVFSTLWAAYKLQIIITGILLVATVYAGWKVSGVLTRRPVKIKLWQAALLSPVVFLMCVIAARSTLDHRAVNPSLAAFSEDPMVNDLVLNSAYALMYAVYESRRDESGGIRYGDMPDNEIQHLIHVETGYDEENFKDQKIPSLHTQKASYSAERPYNLVIILEESLGAEFVGSLGGKQLTPNLDELSSQGIWFENLYATGTRSVRGIEAVITGFPPTPARSVVKLSKTQRNFFTIAKLLERYGYATSFIYGGESHFDNMGRFFMNNGFQKVVDKSNYVNPAFVGSWGVSDEDLFDKAHEEFLNYGEHPFFSLVFTSSNHSPFEFPNGKIELHDTEKHTVNNAVKYADYALGNFIRKASQSKYWRNTIFLIVADHNSRVYGPEVIPVARFHIPGLIIGANIKPERFTPIASQIDLAPTLLSLAGVSNYNPMIGHDLTLPKFHQQPGRALLQYNNTFGYLTGKHLVILQKDHQPEQYLIDHDRILGHETIDTLLAKQALSYSLWAATTLEKQLYHLPDVDLYSR